MEISAGGRLEVRITAADVGKRVSVRRWTEHAAEGEKFTAGKLGPYTVGAAGEIVLGPPTEFTAENIDQFNF